MACCHEFPQTELKLDSSRLWLSNSRVAPVTCRKGNMDFFFPLFPSYDTVCQSVKVNLVIRYVHTMVTLIFCYYLIRVYSYSDSCSTPL